MPNPLAGANLGSIRTAIILDTSNLQEGAKVIGRTTKQIEYDLNQMARQGGQSYQKFTNSLAKDTKTVRNNFKSMSDDIKKMRGELLAIAGVSAGITLFGANAADDIRSTRIQYTALLGSQQKALQLEKQIAQTSRQYGLSISDATKGYRLLLSATEGNVAEAEKLFNLAVRTSSLNPQEGIGGATFAIGEAISSNGKDLVSLAERFNLSKKQLQLLTAETGNFADALDIALNRAGATEQAAQQIGQGWKAALTSLREELRLTAATGFGGLGDTAVPILNQITDALAKIRESSPWILQTGSAFVVAAGSAATFLLVLSKIAETAKTLKELNMASQIAGVGKYAAVGAASLYAGSQIGMGIINLSGAATGNQYQKDFNLNEALNLAKQVVIVTADTYLMLNTVIQNAAIRLRYGFGSIIESIGTFVAMLGKTTRDTRLQATGENIAQYGYKTQAQAIKDQPRVIQEAEAFRRQVIEGLTEAFFPGTFAEEIVDSMAGAADAEGVKDFAEETVIAFGKWQEDIAEIEADAADKRQQIIENAADKRQSIEEKIRETQEASAESAIELEEQIADIREETSKRSENIETEHQRKLLDIQRDFERSREDAVRNLDAKALRDAEITRDRAVEDAELNRSYAEIELEENRANAEERISDLRASFAAEEEDRNLNLEKLRQQLLEVDQERDRDLQNLADATAKQLQIREQAWIEEFNALEENNGRRIEIQRAGLEQMAVELEAWYMAQAGVIASAASAAPIAGTTDYIDRHLNELINQNYTYSDYKPVQSSSYTPATSVMGEDYLARHYALGGDVYGDGPAMLHDKEYVLNPGISDTMRSMFGGAFTGNQLVGALAGGGGGRSITWNGDVNVPNGSSSSAQDIAAAVEEMFTNLLESLN